MSYDLVKNYFPGDTTNSKEQCDNLLRLSQETINLKNVWCSTAVFHSRFAILWLASLNPIVLSKCSNCIYTYQSPFTERISFITFSNSVGQSKVRMYTQAVKISQ